MTSGKPRLGWILPRVLVVCLPFLSGLMVSAYLAAQDDASHRASETMDASISTAPWEFVADRLEGAHLTLAVLPDTQYYTVFFPETFEAQTRWISSHEGIDFVLHLGDVVDHYGDELVEWERARDAMDLLDVPYGVVVGNHDMQPDGSTAMFDYLRPSVVREGKNSYRLQNGWMILFLEYCPPDAAVTWASRTAASHDGPVVLATHAFLASPTSRANCVSEHAEGDNTSAELWRDLVLPNSNIEVVLAGHENAFGGAILRTDLHEGRRIHQLTSNYQYIGEGGDGFLRVMAWHDCRLEVVTYSPTLDVAMIGEGNLLTLPTC